MVCNMNIILISGHAQNGKDTTANAMSEILKEMNYKTLIIHYADFLKYAAKEYFGWNGKKDEVGRSLLQHLGTEVVRTNNPNCWVNIVKEFIIGLGNEVDFVLIPDCRFENEMDWADDIPEITPVKIRVNRPDFDNGLTEEQRNHSSEISLDSYNKFNYVIDNSGSMDDLCTTLMFVTQSIIQSIGG